MLNFNDLLKTNDPDSMTKEDGSKPTLALFYQEEKCRDFLLECIKAGNDTKVVVNKNTDDSIVEQLTKVEMDIMVLELNYSRNIVSEARRISYLLPNKASIVIVGREDSIITIRQLKEMGFYYVYWPIARNELIDFFRHVHSNRTHNLGVDKNRQAKRIAVLGAKGGVGATFVASELTNILIHQKNAKCLYVDHNFYSSDIDIALQLDKFESKIATLDELELKMDSALARTMLSVEYEKLSVLSFSAEELSSDKLRELQANVVDALLSEYNFIVEDLSTADALAGNYQDYWRKIDYLILVATPGVSELREANKLKQKIHALDETKTPLLLVINHVQPEKFSALSHAEINQFLKYTPEAIISFENKANSYLLENKKVSQTKSKVAAELLQFTKLLLGEDKAKKKSLLSRLLGGR
ncbi:hypothetical protein EXA21_08940 [Vibrio cincinnatiensis]|uniref:AAA family ATPase n=1 Tax=Vibrio cincinnatiensis TaxID=675 RepID=UPI001EDCC200|nr:hypothetical protein [Vibrio cincinnatiensis]MCG3759810.1 hypothetical protein [Vibrio cincinnatiensis]MCG3763017.1 hypothetical protein [Vibrio cincinnatiensis]